MEWAQCALLLKFTAVAQCVRDAVVVLYMPRESQVAVTVDVQIYEGFLLIGKTCFLVPLIPEY